MFATFLVYQKCMHIRIGGPVSLGVWYWLVGDKSDCSLIMHTRDATYESRFENLSNEQVSPKRVLF